MLKRIYIDNYKCFSNFEYRPGLVELLVGRNGAGKSTIFGLLDDLRYALNGQAPIDTVFPSESLTRWDKRTRQTVELTVELAESNGLIEYHLEVEHAGSGAGHRVEVVEESLLQAGQPVYRYVEGESHLYRRDGSAGPVYPFDGTQSPLAFVSPREVDHPLRLFRTRWMAQLRVLQINPWFASSDSRHERTLALERGAENFASWLYTQMAEAPELRDRLRRSLSEIWGLTVDWRFQAFGQHVSTLQFSFAAEDRARPYDLGFDELSEGERALIILYAVYHSAMLSEPGGLLCIDEPGAFLALREVQPLLATCYDDFEEVGHQLLIASHHPEVINFMAPNKAVVLAREPGGPTRPPQAFASVSDGMLTPAEAMAEGLLDA